MPASNNSAPARAACRMVFLTLPTAMLLVACDTGNNAAPPAAGKNSPPPAQVAVITVTEREIDLETELPGRVEALRVAQVRARVNGVVQQRLFREGSEVQAGQTLFRIDAAPYRAATDSALAAQAKARANLSQANAQAERYKPLAEANAVSKQDFINVLTAQKQAEADVAAAKAAVQTAQIALSYTQVTAPISGRIGRALVTEGALVSAGEATQLAVIQQTSTVYLNFTQSATELLRLRKALAAGQLRSADAGTAAVRVVLDDGTELSRKGKLLFLDAMVDATSGQILLRAEMPNADGLLMPGQFVRVRLSQAALPAGILLPQQAVTRSNQGDSVLVVGADNKPVPRTVKLGTVQGANWLVLSGLKPGEKVIVDGFQKMMVPGAPVNPVPWTPHSASAPSAPDTAAAPSSAASAR